MKQSTNYNMNKPDPNDMFSLEHWNQNTDKIDETLAPTFEDYTGETPVPTTDEALKNIKSKTKLSILMQNIKAFCKGCCTLGMLVDNCVTNNNNLPLAASQGKILMDQITSLNSDFGSLLKPTTETINIDSLNLENGTYVIGTGMSGTKPFEYGILIQFKRYTYTVQIAIDIDSAAIAKRQTNNERWLNWDFYVTKSDLQHYPIFYRTNGLKDIALQLYKYSDSTYILQIILITSTFTKTINLAEFTM